MMMIDKENNPISAAFSNKWIYYGAPSIDCLTKKQLDIFMQ